MLKTAVCANLSTKSSSSLVIALFLSKFFLNYFSQLKSFPDEKTLNRAPFGENNRPFYLHHFSQYPLVITAITELFDPDPLYVTNSINQKVTQ